jgi:hypothetical protein
MSDKLKAPTPGRTLQHRARLGKRRREEIKQGALQKKRGPPIASRQQNDAAAK